MTTDEQLYDSAPDGTVEHGERYDHVEHGRVEITDIWHGTQWVDAVETGDQQSTIIVRYTPVEDGNWMDELAEPLDEFIGAIQ